MVIASPSFLVPEGFLFSPRLPTSGQKPETVEEDRGGRYTGKGKAKKVFKKPSMAKKSRCEIGKRVSAKVSREISLSASTE